LEPTNTGIQQLQPRIPHQESKTTASRVAICDLSCKIYAKVGTADERVSSFSGYMQMMHLYFGLLDQRNSLDLYDPALTITLQEKGVHVTDNGNNANRLKPTSQLLPKDIDPRTQALREKLKEAMYKCY
jgi:hypothetical protein